MNRVQAALLGAREVGFTVLAISLSLVAVFIPLLFLGGQAGHLFREFAVTLSAAQVFGGWDRRDRGPLAAEGLEQLISDGRNDLEPPAMAAADRKSTRLNSSH